MSRRGQDWPLVRSDGVALELRRHAPDYPPAYNVAKHLTALRWRTPYETLAALWAGRPELL